MLRSAFRTVRPLAKSHNSFQSVLLTSKNTYNAPLVPTRSFSAVNSQQKQEQNSQRQQVDTPRSSGSETPAPALNFTPASMLKIFAIGLVCGTMPAFFGVGGGIILIPALTAWAHFTQRQAQGTSLFAITIASLSTVTALFEMSGAVDLVSAGVISVAASLFATVGALIGKRVADHYLKLFMALLMILAAFLVPLRKHLLSNRASSTEVPAAEQKDEQQITPGKLPSLDEFLAQLKERKGEIPTLAAVGCAVGILSGLMGVGGGILLVPALSLISPAFFTQQMIIGTSLASFALPGVVALTTHVALGNVVLRSLPPLLIGSALGAYLASDVAIHMPEWVLQYGFSILVMFMGIRQLRLGLTKVRQAQMNTVGKTE